jgi:hypothetical protein
MNCLGHFDSAVVMRTTAIGRGLTSTTKKSAGMDSFRLKSGYHVVLSQLELDPLKHPERLLPSKST